MLDTALGMMEVPGHGEGQQEGTCQGPCLGLFAPDQVCITGEVWGCSGNGQRALECFQQPKQDRRSGRTDRHSLGMKGAACPGHGQLPEQLRGAAMPRAAPAYLLGVSSRYFASSLCPGFTP